MEIKNKVVLITGAAHGIGRAVALEFARLEAKIVLNYLHSKDEVLELQLEIQKLGGSALVIQADVSEPNEVDRLFADVLRKFDAIDILVNNAACSKPGDFLQGDTALWQELFKNNLLSVVLCAQKFVQLNQGKSDKKIINIGSVYGMEGQGDPSMLEYSSLKAALHSFTKTLAKQLAPHVLVNAVAPGYTLTPQWRKRSEAFKSKRLNETLIKRFVEPVEIAAAVVFLAENDAVTGNVLVIDGGLSLNRCSDFQ